MITCKEDLIGTIFNIADEEGGANVRLAGLFYDVCIKHGIGVMGGNGRDYFMKAVGEGLVNLCIADDDGLGAFGRASVSKDSEFGSYNKSMSDFRYIGESELKAHLEDLKPQTKEVEWVNGDACRYANDIQHEYTYIGEHPHGDGHYAFSEEKGITYIANGYLLEPETEAERKEREELEAAYDLFVHVQRASNRDKWSFELFCNEKMNDYKSDYLAIVRKTNYKVKGE